MKLIDKHILKSFFGPFVVTFFIALFVLIMQFLWKYIDDLVGKGLEVSIIAELIFYASASVVPLALPIAILLAAIMTFGGLGEHYELVALKSAGISLLRFMAPLIVAATFFVVAAFSFANYVLPIANLQFATVLYSVTRKRPALNIRPGVFYDGLEGYVIRVGSKNPDGRSIYDIKIHDHTAGRGNVNVLLAEQGEMFMTEDEAFLKFCLYNGVQYEEVQEKKGVKEKSHEFMRTYFDEYEMVFDLGAFKFERKNEQLFTNHRRMLNTKQLEQIADSLEQISIKKIANLSISLRDHFSFLKDSTFSFAQLQAIPQSELDTTFLACLPLVEGDKKQLVQRAVNSSKKIKSVLNSTTNQTNTIKRKVVRYWIAYHEKFTLSFACLLLFLIGAPFGAIIRKGGLGMPMVAAILFFILFYILSTAGKRVAEEYVLSPFMGMWGSAFLLFPLGIYLIYKATNDAIVFNMAPFLRKINRILAFMGLAKRQEEES